MGNRIDPSLIHTELTHDLSPLGKFPHGGYCSLTTAGNHVSFSYVRPNSLSEQSFYRPSGAPCIKLSPEEYLDMTGVLGAGPGESQTIARVRRYADTDKRLDNLDSLRKSFRRLRSLLYANCYDTSRLSWMTLTYRRNEDGSPMTDRVRLMKDFKGFIARLTRCAASIGRSFEYICVPEPQASGAWHCHVVLIWDGLRPFLASSSDSFRFYVKGSKMDCLPKSCDELWGQGFTNVRKIKTGDNVAAYLSAYLTDLPPVEGKDTAGLKSKRAQKGERLKFYPKGIRLYRCSKGVERPTSVGFCLDDVDPLDFYNTAKDMISINGSSGKGKVFDGLIPRSFYSVGPDDGVTCAQVSYVLPDGSRASLDGVSGWKADVSLPRKCLIRLSQDIYRAYNQRIPPDAHAIAEFLSAHQAPPSDSQFLSASRSVGHTPKFCHLLLSEIGCLHIGYNLVSVFADLPKYNDQYNATVRLYHELYPYESIYLPQCPDSPWEITDVMRRFPELSAAQRRVQAGIGDDSDKALVRHYFCQSPEVCDGLPF